MISATLKKLFVFIMSAMLVIALFPQSANAEESDTYTLVGVAAHGTGLVESGNTKKVNWEMLVCIPNESIPENIITEDNPIGTSYENGIISDLLEGDPQPDVTYFSSLRIRNSIQDDHSADFSQLTADSVYLMLDGFEVGVIECVAESVDGYDQLSIYYSLMKHQAAYHLKGASMHSDGAVEQDGSWGPDFAGGSLVWDEQEPAAEGCLYVNSVFYSDEAENTPLQSNPTPGQTCYFFILVQNAIAGDHSIDLTDHLDAASLDVTITDYDVAYRSSGFFSIDGKDTVLLHFSARRKNHNKYLVIVADVEHGEVIAEPLEAEENTEITLTAIPEDGYVLDHYTVEDVYENPIEVVNGKFIMPSTAVIVSAVFVKDEGHAELVSQQLYLAGLLSIQFNLTVPQDKEGLRARLTYNIEDETHSSMWADKVDPIIYELDPSLEYYEGQYNGNKTFYDEQTQRFVLMYPNICSGQMTETVTLEILDENDNLQEFEYKGEMYTARSLSVHDYALLPLADENASDSLKDLMKTMLNFGEHSQKVFDYNTGHLPLDDLSEIREEMNQATSSVTALAANDILIDPNDPNDRSIYRGMQLKLEGETSIYLNFNKEISSATVNGRSVTPTQSNGIYTVRISNIPSGYLSRRYTVTVTIDGTQYTYEASALSYCNNVLNSSSAPDDLKDLCRSIYLYSAAADAYFHTGE